jgi:hypothetical protein
MYICSRCKQVTKPHESCCIVVAETRPRKYVNSVMKGTGLHAVVREVETQGTEIVREEKICKACSGTNHE